MSRQAQEAGRPREEAGDELGIAHSMIWATGTGKVAETARTRLAAQMEAARAARAEAAQAAVARAHEAVAREAAMAARSRYSAPLYFPSPSQRQAPVPVEIALHARLQNLKALLAVDADLVQAMVTKVEAAHKDLRDSKIEHGHILYEGRDEPNQAARDAAGIIEQSEERAQAVLAKVEAVIAKLRAVSQSATVITRAVGPWLWRPGGRLAVKDGERALALLSTEREAQHAGSDSGAGASSYSFVPLF